MMRLTAYLLVIEVAVVLDILIEKITALEHRAWRRPVAERAVID